MAELDPTNSFQREKLRRLFKMTKVLGELMLQNKCDLSKVLVGFITRDKVTKEVDLSQFQDLRFSFDDFLRFRKEKGVFQNRNSFTSLYVNNMGQRFFVVFFDNEPGKSVSKEEFKKFETSLGVLDRGRSWLHGAKIYLVSENGLGADPASFLEKSIQGYDITPLTDNFLAFNVTKHALCPVATEHIPRIQRGPNEPDSIKEWAAKEGISPAKLPLIEHLDPIATWHSVKPGDILVNWILSPVADVSIKYELCRKAPKK